MKSSRLLSVALITGLLASVVLPVMALTLSFSTVATDSDPGADSILLPGGQKLIVDSAGKHLAVYVDSNGRIAVSVANGDPRLAGAWSALAKSPAPSSAYARPAAVLVSQTSLRIIAEGGTGSHRLVDVPATLTRDSGGNIVSISYGSTATLDSSGSAYYPSAILAHDGGIVVVWNVVTSSVSKVNGLRWIPGTGWRSLIDASSSTPTTLVTDSSNKSPIYASVIERVDNRKLYVVGNRGSGSSNMVFNSASFNGQSWNVGNQNLSYETNAARGIEDATSVTWDQGRKLVVVAYDISGTNKYGIFSIDSSDKKTHLDTPSLSVDDNDGGIISVDSTTGDYYLFILDALTDGGTGRVIYIRRSSGSWSSSITVIDSGSDVEAVNGERATTPELSILYAKGKSGSRTIKFATLSGGSPPPPPPTLTASFTFSPRNPSTGSPVTFTASATGGVQPYSFSWNFDDGSSTTGNPVSHVFGVAASYNVILTVTDSGGQTATSSQVVTVTSQNSFTFSPTDDAFVQLDTPAVNYGGSTELTVDNSPVKNIMIKFDVQVAGTITSATLRLFQVDASDVGGEFRTAASNWTETTVNWNNAPAASPSTFFSLGPVSSNTWYDVDMSQVVTSSGFVSIRVTSPSSDGSHFSSKEGQHPPQLIVSGASTTNPPPRLTVPGPQTVSERTQLSFTITATDDPNQTITLTASGLPSGAQFTSTPAKGTVSGTFTWTPSESQGPGSYSVSFQAADDQGATSFSSVGITVNEVNLAPSVSAPSSAIAVVNTTLTISVTGSDTDLPPNTVSLTAIGLVTGMSFTSTPGTPASGTFTFTPGPSQVGQVYTVTFTATDNGNPVLTTNRPMTVSVTSAPPSPSVYALVSASDGNVYRYYQNGTVALVGQSSGVLLRQVASKPDGSYALIVGTSAALVKYDGVQLIPIPTNVSSSIEFFAVAWRPDGSYALIGGGGGTMLRYDGVSIATVVNPSGSTIRAITWNPSGGQALIVGSSGTMLLYQASNGQILSITSGTTLSLYSAAWNPSGQYAIAAGTNGILVKYDGTSVTTINTTGIYDPTRIVRHIEWNSAGSLALLAGDSGLVLSYDGTTLTALNSGTTNGLYSLSWLGTTATIVGNSGTILTYANGVITQATSTSSSFRGIAWKPA